MGSPDGVGAPHAAGMNDVRGSGGSCGGSGGKTGLWWPVPPLERVAAWATAVLGVHLVTLQPNDATQQAR